MAERSRKDPVFGLFTIDGPWRRGVHTFFTETDGVYRLNPGVSYYTGTQRLTRGTSFPVHRHDFLEAVIVADGTLIHETSSVRTLTPYDAIFLNPAQTHRFSAGKDGVQIVTFSFLPSLLGYNDRVITECNLDICALLTPFDRSASPVHRIPEAAAKRILFFAFTALERLRYAANDEHEIGKNAFRLAITSLLEVVRSGSKRGKKTWMIDILSYIQKHYRKRISQKALAERFGLSAPMLSTEFNRITGTTLATYINRLRIEDAKRLLAETALPVGHIALDVGFESITHFNDVFREITGTRPTEYRKR